MIIVEVIGGLGNQMFQYALGRALSCQQGDARLMLDTSKFETYNLHNGFELSRIFTGEFKLASNRDINEVLGFRSIPIVRRLLSGNRFSQFRGSNFVVEPHFHYWPEIKNVTPDSYLVGYWQSEKYFKTVEDILRQDFTFKIPLSDRNELVLCDMRKQPSISLHIRRGDYVQNANTLATHGVCSLEYYRSAIGLILEKVNNPKFFIFSDDQNWVKENLKIDHPCSYVDHNKGGESYNDMRLMSLCDHHIIANSSFSWWGAWLNPSRSKIVISPNKWFASTRNLTVDLCPSDWIKL